MKFRLLYFSIFRQLDSLQSKLDRLNVSRNEPLVLNNSDSITRANTNNNNLTNVRSVAYSTGCIRSSLWIYVFIGWNNDLNNVDLSWRFMCWMTDKLAISLFFSPKKPLRCCYNANWPVSPRFAWLDIVWTSGRKLLQRFLWIKHGLSITLF